MRDLENIRDLIASAALMGDCAKSVAVLSEAAALLEQNVAELEERKSKPVDMVLYCPDCGMQHIDAPDLKESNTPYKKRWMNPPHRSHLCEGCGHVWRPADVYTNGVEAIKTQGKSDSRRLSIGFVRKAKTEIDKLVDRFLAWPLPNSVKVDTCATILNHPYRSGTNLLTALEAKAMFKQCLGECDHDYHYFGDMKRRRCNNCNQLEPE